MLPGGPELLHVDLGARGEDEGHVAEERAGLTKAHGDQRSPIILELVTDLETVRGVIRNVWRMFTKFDTWQDF